MIGLLLAHHQGQQPHHGIGCHIDQQTAPARAPPVPHGRSSAMPIIRPWPHPR